MTITKGLPLRELRPQTIIEFLCVFVKALRLQFVCEYILYILNEKIFYSVTASFTQGTVEIIIGFVAMYRTTPRQFSNVNESTYLIRDWFRNLNFNCMEILLYIFL